MSDRLLLQARLKPLQGDLFRPTGFPDSGAAEYLTPSGELRLLVESPQSIANHLEAAVWDDLAEELIPALAGVPYVRLLDAEHGLLTSIVEPNRLGAARLFPSVEPDLREELGKPRQRGRWGPAQVARALLKLDPGTLLHGSFIYDLRPALRVDRMLGGYIEARDVHPVVSGGVRFDHADPSGPASRNLGHIPFHCTDYTAGSIRAYFCLDLLLLESYGLSQQANSFFVDLSLYKILRFLRRGLRLRSSCLLQLVELTVQEPYDFVIPTEDQLESRLAGAIAALRASGEFGPVRSYTA